MLNTTHLLCKLLFPHFLERKKMRRIPSSDNYPLKDLHRRLMMFFFRFSNIKQWFVENSSSPSSRYGLLLMLGGKSRSTYSCANSSRSAKLFIQLERRDFLVKTFFSLSLDLVPPTINQIERHYTGYVGQSIKLSCQANGIPIPRITWHGINNISGSVMIDSFGNLYIDQLE